MSSMTQAGKNDAPSPLKRRAALASVAASLALTLAKFAAGTMAGSLALLSEAAHNGLDVGASALTYYAVRVSDKPADEDHPFGHAKIEAVAALAQTGFLIVLAVAVAFEALRRIGEAERRRRQCLRLRRDPHVDRRRSRALARPGARRRGKRPATRSPPTRCIFPAISFPRSSSSSASRRRARAGRTPTRSPRSASPSSSASPAFGWDGAPSTRWSTRRPRAWRGALRVAVERVPGVAGTDFVRLRRTGARIVGDLGLLVSRTLPLERVAAIKAEVAAAIARRWPYVALTVTANPLALDDETVLERVQLIAGRRRLFVHHVARSERRRAQVRDARPGSRRPHEPGERA